MIRQFPLDIRVGKDFYEAIDSEQNKVGTYY